MLLMCVHRHLQVHAACGAAPVLCQWPFASRPTLRSVIGKGMLLRGFTK